MAFRTDRLNERIAAKHLTQTELANAVGVSARMIRDYKTGHSVPDGEHLTRLAIALETNTDYLLGHTDDSLPNLHLTEGERQFILWLRSLAHEPATEDVILYFASQDVPRQRHPRTKR